MLKTKRGIIKAFFLSIITLGIYPMYLIHAAAKETNLTCHGDGRKTKGFIAFFFLSLITFEIYGLFVWPHGIIKRWNEFLIKHNQKTRVSPGGYVCWVIFGSLLAGIGFLIAEYKFLHTWDDVNKIYNIEQKDNLLKNREDKKVEEVKNPPSALIQTPSSTSTTKEVAISRNVSKENELSAFAVIGMVFGVFVAETNNIILFSRSLPFISIMYLSSFLGIIFSAIGMRSKTRREIAIIGLVVSIAAIIFSSYYLYYLYVMGFPII